VNENAQPGGDRPRWLETTQEAWALRIRDDRAHHLAVMRGRADVEGSRVSNANGTRGAWWVRGRQLDDEVLAMPHDELHRWDPEDDRLYPLRGKLPVARLPDLSWRPLEQLLVASPPEPALPGDPVFGSALRLERAAADEWRPANALLTDLPTWTAACGRTLEMRRDHLRFALASDGRVLVRGFPLPAVAGRPLVEDEGIAVPAGWRWSPAVAAKVLARYLRLARGDLALLHRDGTWERIVEEHFVPATRSAARLSLRHES